MSRVYKALRQSSPDVPGNGAAPPLDMMSNAAQPSLSLTDLATAPTQISPTSRLVSLTDPGSIGAERFRVLAAKLNHICSSQKISTIQVTSSTVNEGKSLVAANLALTLAGRADRNVLLMDGDLRHPVLSDLFGLARLPGLCEWWADPHLSLDRIVYKLSGTRLLFLPASQLSDPDQLLQSERLSRLLSQLSTLFDWIIIDSPPILPFADSGLWARLADGSLLVVRQGKTPIRFLHKATDSLDTRKLLGVVLNEVLSTTNDDYSHYYQKYAGSAGARQGTPAKVR